MADQKIIGKALRLKRLADQGVGGERDAARKALDKLLLTGKVIAADLIDKDESPEVFEFFINGEYERKLLLQIAFMITNSGELHGFRMRNHVHIKLTPKQAAELDATYSHYKKEWRELQEKALTALIMRHDIYPSNGPEYRPESKHEVQSFMDARRLAQQLGTKHFSGKLQLT